MEPLIQLRVFSLADEPSLYEQYLGLKYEVFVAEQGWTGLADPSGRRIVREEPYDEVGQLCLASTLDGEPIGVVRSIAVAKGFPHRELLEHHLHRAEVQVMWDQLGTMNALAVLPPYRGIKYRVVDLGWSGSAAKLLMLYAIHQMEHRGLRAALATTGSLASMRLCRHLGFWIIDRPKRVVHLHPAILAANVGIVFGSPPHLQAQLECTIASERARPLEASSLSLLRYLEERQSEVLRGGSIDAVYSGP